LAKFEENENFSLTKKCNLVFASCEKNLTLRKWTKRKKNNGPQNITPNTKDWTMQTPLKTIIFFP
jgi:hypothetical protein